MPPPFTIAQDNARLLAQYKGYTLEEIYSLRDYSFKWFKPINILLRNGYDGLTKYFEENRLRRGITKFNNFTHIDTLKRPATIPEAIGNVETRISHIDSAFLNAKTKKTEEKMIVYRGKKGNYYDVSQSIHTGSPSKINIDTGYISTTESIESALRFVNNDKQDKEYKTTKQHCCLYRMHIMKGIPYIDMTTLSQYKESEILLPRDLKITIIESDDESIESDDESIKSDDESIESDDESIESDDESIESDMNSKELSEKYNVKIIDVKVEKSTENQFDKKPKNNIVTEPVGGNRRIKRRTNKLKNTHKRRTTKRRITKRRITKRRITKRRTKNGH
jgi:hypothetical protein